MNTKNRLIISLAASYLMAFSLLGFAHGISAPQIIRPQSNFENPEDPGTKPHTHLRVMIPSGGLQALNTHINAKTSATGKPPYPGYLYETPASLGCLYGLTPPVAGCNPNTVTANPIGGSRAIAIVDAYNYTTALKDLQTYSNQFGLAAPNLTVVYSNGTPPRDTSGWSLESALDLQMAHAMAPNAALYLVLAPSNSFTDLFNAVKKASALVAAAGGGEVSMSWGGSEFNGETSYDNNFTTPNVVYTASTGDAPGTEYPSTSPNIVGVGGTTISRNYNTGNFERESAWAETGGGVSLYESIPSYQSALSSVLGSHRGSPDVALLADPNTGVWVYFGGNSAIGAGAGWYIFGGTSVAAPMMAGIINAAGNFAASSAVELSTQIYSNLGNGANFNDITVGNCGYYMGNIADVGWDLCTGVGRPIGYF